MKKIKDIPKNERPREKLLSNGAGNLTDQELLAVILGKGTQKLDVLALSQKIIKLIDEAGIELEAEELQKVEGIGSAKGALLAAAFEFVRRRIKPEGSRILFPADVLPLIRHYSDRKQEYLIAVSLNGAKEVLNVRVITIGLVDRTQIHPREVFADAITDRASSIIIAHNHPVGDLQPSRQDINVTTRLQKAGMILGIELVDHIIFNRTDYFSFLENELLL